MIIQEQLGDEPLEPLDFAFELTEAAFGIILGGVVPFTPSIIGGLSDADLPTDVGDGESFCAVVVGVAQQSRDLVGGPSLLHEVPPR